MPANQHLQFLLLATDLRIRGMEFLIRAASMHDAEAQEMMRTVAASYEKFARRLEQLAI